MYHRNKIRNGNDLDAQWGGGTLAVAVVEDFRRLANKLRLPEIGALPAWWEKKHQIMAEPSYKQKIKRKLNHHGKTHKKKRT